MDYVVGTVHGQGYTRIFTTERYLPTGLGDADTAAWQSDIQARGREIVNEAFAVIDARLPETGYALGG
jgi:glutathione S-transferase